MSAAKCSLFLNMDSVAGWL
jgi:fructose-specific phosphotransferase system IIC component